MYVAEDEKGDIALESIDTSNAGFYKLSEAESHLKRKYTQLDRHLEHLQTLNWEGSLHALAATSTSYESQQFFTAIETMEDPETGILE